MTGDPPIARRSLEQLAADIGVAAPGMGAGVACATTSALAASLVALVARASQGRWDDAAGIAAQAMTLGARAHEMADAGARAFAAAMSALDSAAETGDFKLGTALHDAADVLLRIVTVAADIAELAAETARNGVFERRADAVVAATLAEAAARSASRLVEINLAVGADDARLAEARHDLEAATQARLAAETSAAT